MRYRITAALLGVPVLLGVTATPASATDYGKPSGRWLQAIVSHEVGHCLGADLLTDTHRSAYPSILRPSLKPTYINSGAHPYTPTSTDLSRMAASRADSTNGVKPNYYVQNPWVRDYVPVYNRTGVSAVFTAADRWDAYTPLNIAAVTYEPASGITIQWNSSLAGTSVGGRADVTEWHWNGSFWQPVDCVVQLNPRVVT
jgi:predicted Zn-dependent protease